MGDDDSKEIREEAGWGRLIPSSWREQNGVYMNWERELLEWLLDHFELRPSHTKVNM